jgi:hypothetical protein
VIDLRKEESMIRSARRFGAHLAAAALAALALAGQAAAQTDVTTTRASGTVQDAAGGALP